MRLSADLARLFTLACLALFTVHAWPREPSAFGFDEVTALARTRALQPWHAADSKLPPSLAALDYDARRELRFRPERSVWREAGLPFELQFFHRARTQSEPVALHEIVDGLAQPLAYRAEEWDLGHLPLDPRTWGDLGHAGFRVHHALNSPAYKDELIAFLGASYFRALGRGQQYGLSARGLAIDTTGAPPGRGEEFPRFTDFWIERPAPRAETLVLYALLDTPRASAAYRFEVRPGEDTVVEVTMRLFMRAGAAPLATLGIAPLTSMYLHGANQAPSASYGSDFRPRVHDSDGLMLAAAAPGAQAVEWLWRPLVNPGSPLTSSFAAARLQGFGLMQRERRFGAYEDAEAHYERRPSAWVEPVGDWGAGRVELLQLPAPDETYDNIVAYWVPASLPAPGQALALSWRIHWQGDAPQQPPGGWAVQTRRGRGWTPLGADELQFIVDFDGPALRGLPPDALVEAVASAGTGGRITEARAVAHPLGGWRLQLHVRRDAGAPPLELRAFLRHDGRALTETWSALIPHESDTP